ncbi:MAG TPA: CHAP domain-containing protein [Arthrobacter sp.]
MKMLSRAGGAFFITILFAASLLVAVVLGAVSGGRAGASTDPSSCVAPLPGAGLAAGKVPAEYVEAIREAAKASGIPAPILAGQLRQESNFNPKAVSHAGARGIAQFMPGTWASYGQGKDPSDPQAGISAQGRFMGELLKQAKASGFAGDPVDLALAGYNAGWGGVTAVGGIPDNGETAQYVTRIRQFANEFAAKDGTDAVTAGEDKGSGDCDLATGTSSGNDDYPFKDLPHCILNANGGYAGCPAGSQSEFNAFHGECVDFVMWRLNQQFGVVKAPWKIMNGNFRPDGGVLGDARDYRAAWENKGWPVDKTPTVGAVVWYGPANANASSAGYGHVAIVKEVLKDGSFIEEGYNFGFPPDDHKYYTIKRANSAPDNFLHLPKAG